MGKDSVPDLLFAPGIYEPCLLFTDPRGAPAPQLSSHVAREQHTAIAVSRAQALH